MIRSRARPPIGAPPTIEGAASYPRWEPVHGDVDADCIVVTTMETARHLRERRVICLHHVVQRQRLTVGTDRRLPVPHSLEARHPKAVCTRRVDQVIPLIDPFSLESHGLP